MKNFRREILITILVVFVSVSTYPQTDLNTSDASVTKKEKKKQKRKKYKLPDIDLSHWKVTLPIGEDGRALEVEPPEIMDYATNETLRPFMYNDSSDGSLVFYAYPAKTTANTKYSRTELREQMEPGENNVNWKFSDGATMKGTMAMDEVSKDKNGKYHKVIIMQIHGRLSNEQRDLIGQKDNNAPPVLKIYWDKGKIRVKTKELINPSVPNDVILHKEAWTDDKGQTFEQEVGFRKFKIEVKVSEGKMVVSLNNNEYFVYDNPSIRRWDIFENYFKAGNYLQTTDDGAFAKVKIYDLIVEH